MVRTDPHRGTPDKLIFLHIQKTGGTTLGTLLLKKYRPAEVYRIKDAPQDELMRAYQRLPQDARANIRFLRGHIVFGVHDYIDEPSTYITLLRRPVERVVSYYHHVWNNPKNYLHEQVRSRDMSLIDFVQSDITIEHDNGQARRIAGVADSNPIGAYPEDMLDRAIDNLNEHFSVVGLTHRFDETLLLVREALGWPRAPLYARQRVARDRPAPANLSPATRRAIEKHNQLDLALFEHVEKQFNRTLAERGDAFQNNLRRFRQRNRLYRPCAEAYWSTRMMFRRVKALVVG